jgi:hypothetical protein
MFGSLFKRKESPSLGKLLEDLAACGVRLLPAATPAALERAWSKERYEREPHKLALIALGGEPPLAENIWHFDVECIEDDGAYARIAERTRMVAGGDLPLTNIQDHVDLDAGEAWLSFELDGKVTRWACHVDDDWVDPDVMSQFAMLLTERNTGRRLVYLDLQGQDCIVTCLSKDELKRIRKVTGLAFKWAE